MTTERNDTIHSFFDIMDIVNSKNEIIINDCLDQYFPFYLFLLMFKIRSKIFKMKKRNTIFNLIIFEYIFNSYFYIIDNN